MAHQIYDKSGRFHYEPEFHVQTVFQGILYVHCHLIEEERIAKNKTLVTEHCIGSFCGHVIELRKNHEASFVHHLN